ncbi:hypothetical protein ACRARG_02385 [Pseudooceanicola sp. C21-150M6]|uniref:hypothetical protein n=1 Tax=Pseudooceanicola sp. C21-150M6 TaxID=3434355 RepID=UPI003D7F8519
MSDLLPVPFRFASAASPGADLRVGEKALKKMCSHDMKSNYSTLNQYLEKLLRRSILRRGDRDVR